MRLYFEGMPYMASGIGPPARARSAARVAARRVRFAAIARSQCRDLRKNLYG